jgi:hypothetical protein
MRKQVHFENNGAAQTAGKALVTGIDIHTTVFRYLYGKTGITVIYINNIIFLHYLPISSSSFSLNSLIGNCSSGLRPGT